MPANLPIAATAPSAQRPNPHAIGTASTPEAAIARAWARVEAALSPQLDIALSQWHGHGDPATQCLLVTGSQRDADTLDCLRHLDAATKHFTKVGFYGPAATRRLVEWSLGERVVVLSRLPRETTDWDLRCPLTLLPQALRVAGTTAPTTLPSLRVLPSAACHWRDRLAANAQHGLCVGITWTERASTADRPSGIPRLTQLAPLFDVPGVTWINLQRWGGSDGRAHLPGDVDWLDWTGDIDDAADEAALIDNLDLVVSVDAAAVHLAGGLGVPVWHIDDREETATQDALPGSLWANAGYAQMRRFPTTSPGSWHTAAWPAAEALRTMASQFMGWMR